MFATKCRKNPKKGKLRKKKAIFKDNNVKSIIVYASSPVQKVIGEFEIGKIFNNDLETLWKLTKDHSGITEDFFYEYFSERKKGFAIQVKNKKKYKEPKCLKADYNLHPPQSFVYVK